MDIQKDVTIHKSKNRTSDAFRRLFNKNEVGIAIPMVAIVILISIINPVFIDPENIVNILRQTSFTFIIAITMTFILIGAGIDLSVGSVLALAGVITGIGLISGIPIIVSIILGLVVAAAVGLLNGILITRYKIPSLIVTLGMMYFARGVVQVLTKGNPIYPFPDTFNFLGQGYILHVPVCVIIAAILGLLAHVVLKYTVFGRALYAVGGNAETARHSGIKVPSIQTWMYLLSGVAAGVAGVLTTARLGSAQANAGTGMELQVIAACVIGGTSMFGGEGSVLGSLIGALFMGIIANGLVLMRISVFYQNMVIGAVIIVAVGIDQYKRKASGI